jgi:hypothetical protein
MGESESGSEESHELENLERADGGTDEPYFDGCRGSARNPRMSRLPVLSPIVLWFAGLLVEVVLVGVQRPRP